MNVRAQESQVQGIISEPHAENPQAQLPNYDSTYLIHASGFPWLSTKHEIVKFFNRININILNGTNGIHFMIGKTKNSRNEAMVQLATGNDYKLATTQKMKCMGSVPVKSKFIIIFHFIRFCVNFGIQFICEIILLVTQPRIIDFMYLVSKPSYPSEQKVLRVEQLPLSCTTDDIRNYFDSKFFSGFHFDKRNSSDRNTCNEHSVFLQCGQFQMCI